MAAAQSERRANWYPRTITALTLAWVSSVLYFFWRAFKAGMDAQAAYYGGPSRIKQTALNDVSMAAIEHMFVALAVGPVVIATVAAIGRLRKTAIVFSVIAVPTLLLGGFELSPDAPQQTPPSPPGYDHCVERSGGDARCPGG